MAADELIDEHVSSAQALKAAKALHAYATKKQTERDADELLPTKDEHVWLVVGTKVMHPEKKLKPHRIPLKHPLVDPRETSICLITKDPQREYKDLLADKNINFIHRVVGVTKLKGKYRGYDARRALLQENGLFLADDRVIPLLPQLLGSKFFVAKKQPIPVSLTKQDLKAELERAVESTYFHQNKGTCTSVKLGPLNASFGPAKLLDNLKTALPAVVAAIKGGWENIQNLHLKTSTSASLPIWTCDLGDAKGARWDGLTVGAAEDEEKEKPASKGKKRSKDESDEEDSATPKATPAKKANAKDDTTPKATPSSSSAAKAKKDDKASVDTPPKKKRKNDDGEAVAASATPAKKTKDDASVPAKKAKDTATSTPAKAAAPSSSSKKKKDGAALTPSKADASTPAKKEKEKPKSSASTPSAAAKPKSTSTPASEKPKSTTTSTSSPAPPKSALKSALKPTSSASTATPAKRATFAVDVTPAELKAKKKSASVSGTGSKKDKVVARDSKSKEKKAAMLVGKDKRR
ncbi:ribosomal protein L1 [Exidia glandulosa HHB12029]|uniref:Ribosomal L1 domain-containing protein 1 n=1 Tax=Exidia glandulosa HHB12029 TaxID=1314781 RepID=A0A166NJF1_EXIGL|nr:ribosomal protein L1 [Exidia glandulosa HHB12029]